MRKIDKNLVLYKLEDMVRYLIENEQAYYSAIDILEAMIYIDNIDIIKLTEKQTSDLIINKLIELINELIEKSNNNEKIQTMVS